MIARLKGVVDTILDNAVILDVQGVGYLLSCSRRTLADFPAVGEFVSMYTEMVVRQDMIQLYGFSTQSEKDWFLLLTTVQGVGMKVALSILSALKPDELQQALASQDKASFTQADGVGPKLAARIVNELKDKVPAGFSVHNVYPLPTRVLPIQQEALSALVNLGYRRQEALEALNQACQNQDVLPTLEELIKIGLSQLARK